ncbi:hypothetical protein MMC08_003094 [Hypocenomyce scalaris]|nr:hypothetical protein [Hypocenomyce scalaris]
MSGRRAIRRSTDDGADSDEDNRIRRRRPDRQDSSRVTPRRIPTAGANNGERTRRYRSPDGSSPVNMAPASGGVRLQAAANAGDDGVRLRQAQQASVQGTRSTSRHSSSAALDDVDEDLQRTFRASNLERQKLRPVIKNFDDKDLEETIRRSKEEHEAKVRREEEEVERAFENDLQYISSDSNAIRKLNAAKARQIQEEEEAQLERILKESVAAEAERQARMKAKEKAQLNALYARFGSCSNDVHLLRSQANNGSQNPPEIPVAPHSRTSSIPTVGRASPLTRAPSQSQKPQRSPSVRLDQTPAPPLPTQPATTYTPPTFRESAIQVTIPASRQPTSPCKTPVSRQGAIPYITPASRQPASARLRSPQPALAASEDIDEADRELLEAIAASNETHHADQAPRGDEGNYESLLQRTIDASLGQAEGTDVAFTGLQNPPPSYEGISTDRVIDARKWTSAGGDEGSKASPNTPKEVARIIKIKKAERAAEEKADRKRKAALNADFMGEAALRDHDTTSTQSPSSRRPPSAVAGPSRSSSTTLGRSGVSTPLRQVDMMRSQPTTRIVARPPNNPPPAFMGSVAPMRTRATPWNDAFASIAPPRNH